jgi:beta-mannosidase
MLCSVSCLFGGIAPLELNSDWRLLDAAKVSQTGKEVSAVSYHPEGWQAAVVPGTVLTSLVQDGVYPEPLYGENNRRIPETLCRTAYWYRTGFQVPKGYAGKTLWLNFDGINYAAEVWVNGRQAGKIRGAFARGVFDISELVKPGEEAALAVLVSPQPNPGTPIEHTIANGMGKNGGITAMDGPTFLCTIGWDWIPGIRDRNTGIWRKVFLSATGPVVVKDPLVTSDLPLPSLDSADLTIQATVENTSGQAQKGVLKGSFGDTVFEMPVELEAHAARQVVLDPKTFPQLHLLKPQLWWPNGFGPQNLYRLRLSFETGGTVSDQQDVSFGIRKITYTVADSENLTLSVNGVRVFCKGGNWGMDEAMKRIPRERLDAQIRMHQMANYTMIRNWVGQSTSEDFYDLCDKYGLMLWDEFFQPNPSDGPNPEDLDLYIANVREKILCFRNHPSIAVWCARNEGYPPKNIDDALRKLMAELEPVRLYQPSSTAGRGVKSGGPYRWRVPQAYYDFREAFKTEVGSVSVPTLESIQGMMPEKDWTSINDDWAEHDLAGGAQAGNIYPNILNQRYGRVANLADFARKGQMANYEAFRAMYEGRNAKLFHPCTGVLTWMSNPAQPSFVWQLYHYDLEPNASLFAVRKACEPVHVQLNEKTGEIDVINNLASPLAKARAHCVVYNLNGTVAQEKDLAVEAPASAAAVVGTADWPPSVSPVQFLKLELRDADGKLLSDNFYWHALAPHPDELGDLNKLPVVTLEAEAKRHDAEGKCIVDVVLHNPGKQVALMTHLQLRREKSKDRVLPVFYTDNYISLAPGETRGLTIEAALADLKGENAWIVVDGWNIGVGSSSGPGVSVSLNAAAQVGSYPASGLAIDQVRPGKIEGAGSNAPH